MPSLPKFSRRPIEPADDAFLRGLFASVRLQELAPVAWSDQQKAAFLSSQFDAQTRHYLSNYTGAIFEIIECENVPIGRITTHRTAQSILLMDVALIPEFRCLGVGTTLLKELISEARSKGIFVELQVEQRNPAKRLYERLGFEVRDQNEVNCMMEWHS